MSVEQGPEFGAGGSQLPVEPEVPTIPELLPTDPVPVQPDATSTAAPVPYEIDGELWIDDPYFGRIRFTPTESTWYDEEVTKVTGQFLIVPREPAEEAKTTSPNSPAGDETETPFQLGEVPQTDGPGRHALRVREQVPVPVTTPEIHHTQSEPALEQVTETAEAIPGQQEAAPEPHEANTDNDEMAELQKMIAELRAKQAKRLAEAQQAPEAPAEAPGQLPKRRPMATIRAVHSGEVAGGAVGRRRQALADIAATHAMDVVTGRPQLPRRSRAADDTLTVEQASLRAHIAHTTLTHYRDRYPIATARQAALARLATEHSTAATTGTVNATEEATEFPNGLNEAGEPAFWPSAHGHTEETREQP